MTKRNGCPLRLDVGLPIITYLPAGTYTFCVKGANQEWSLVSGYEMSAYNYSSAALVIVVGLLPFMSCCSFHWHGILIGLSETVSG